MRGFVESEHLGVDFFASLVVFSDCSILKFKFIVFLHNSQVNK